MPLDRLTTPTNSAFVNRGQRAPGTAFAAVLSCFANQNSAVQPPSRVIRYPFSSTACFNASEAAGADKAPIRSAWAAAAKTAVATQNKAHQISNRQRNRCLAIDRP